MLPGNLGELQEIAGNPQGIEKASPGKIVEPVLRTLMHQSWAAMRLFQSVEKCPWAFWMRHPFL